MDTLLLNKSEVGSLIDLDVVLNVVEEGYRSFNRGHVVQPDYMHIAQPGTDAEMDFKCGLDTAGGYMSIKCSSGRYRDNLKIGLPPGMNTVLLFDADTSALKCIMDGSWITGSRTAAAGAISVKYLARKDADKLCIIGAGKQARQQLRAIMRIRDLSKVALWSYREEEVRKFVDEMSQETGLNIKGYATAEDAVRIADIVVTTTVGRRGPIVKREWLKPGTHIAAIGADLPDKQELHTDIFRDAKIVNDSIRLCIKNGETHHAVEENIISVDAIYAEIGEIILGMKPGRENDEEITVFDTVGMAIQDNVTAAFLYKAALAKGLGVYYDFLK